MTLRCVAVVGAGTMGAGIAQVCAQAGWKTNLYDAFPEGLERGMERIAAFWEKGIARGKPRRTSAKAWAANLTAVDDLARAVGEADLIIEAVPELPELKHSLFAKLDELAPPPRCSRYQHVLPFHCRHCRGDVKTRTGDWHAFFQPCSHHETA